MNILTFLDNDTLRLIEASSYSNVIKDRNHLIELIQKYDKDTYWIDDEDYSDKNHVEEIKRNLAQYEADYKKQYGDPRLWDVSHVTDMSRLFVDCMEIWEGRIVFDFDLSRWNVSNVTDMESFFNERIVSFDLSKWDVSKVENMNSMFKEAEFESNEIMRSLENWNVKNLKYFDSLFYKSNFKGSIYKWNLPNNLYARILSQFN